ncbi:MAG TPA: AMP-binding protein [Planosporangium sp.]|jgi:acyl-CoA synthetase (AMP-forming)/AMP-acid ligase II|nr:AMP-binding protein [Planosporangium sp.]
MLTIDMVRAGARWYRDRVAVRAGDEQATYGEIDELSSRLANALIGLDVAAGQRVGLLLGNGLHTIAVDFACLKARATRVPLNARLSEAEHARMLTDADVALLVHEPAYAERAAALRQRIDGLVTLSLGPSEAGSPDLLDAAANASPADPDLPARPDDVILALYTSGTTGTLKAARHTQASYAAIVRNILLNLINPGPDDVMLHAAPLIHASGTFVLPFWLRGGCAAVLPGFEPGAWLDALVRHRVTHTNLVPTMLQMLLASGATAEQGASLRSVIYGASPMPRPTIEAAMELWGPIFTQYYGQTEAPLAITVLRPEDHVGADAPLSAAGRPAVDAQVRLVDADGAEVPAGEAGEIAVRAPFTMAGYLDAPELDAATWLGDGWLRTRDVGRFDDAGLLHLIDRTSDMIITGGYNVYPREVEDALLSYPGVAEAAVVGAPDPTWVESVVAFVVARPGAQLDRDALAGHVRDRVAGYKVPKRIEVVESVPKSAVGKILRRELRDRLRAQATAQ